ncbi:Kua-ubiquitin conjugating enzyme hybrid localization domain-containing protein [Pelagophyceae sp. CCMP2097]|nr:Kua-ubiquitin conjugating enzyme hybrid localization domain-containing protein [Pelagophyceae sp. CCMP2097]
MWVRVAVLARLASGLSAPRSLASPLVADKPAVLTASFAGGAPLPGLADAAVDVAAAPGGERRAPKAWRPAAPVLTLPGDTLETRPPHVALLAGCTVVAAAGAARAASRLGAPTAVAAVAAGVGLADLFSGVFHWATDNYGGIDTPIFGQACAAFQGHHLAPWTITYRSTSNNVHKIAKAATPAIAAAAMLAPPALGLSLVVMFYGQVLAQEFHKWSHFPPSEQPPLMRRLQRWGLALSTAEHGRHHTQPYHAHYCIFNGMLNQALDKSNFWRRLEACVFRFNGAEPNCWLDGEKGANVRRLALSL